MHTSVASKTQTWFENIKNQFKGYPDWVVEAGIFGLLALIVGFLLRNFGRYIIFSLLSIIVVLFVFDSCGLIVVDMVQIKAFIGLSSRQSFDDVVRVVMQWSSDHVPSCVAIVLGFLFGWKIGK